MLTDREVLSTLNMLRNEHLDVRTVTRGISLFDCASHDFDVFAYRVRAKIAKYAAKLVATCNEVGDKFGIPVVNKRISVSPIGVVGASFSRDQMVRACQVLDESAKDAGVDFLGGFGALVEKGITPGERNLIDALPEALATTDRICSSINVAAPASIWMPWPCSASASLMSPKPPATVTASAAPSWWCSPTFRRTCPSWRARTSAWASPMW